ncbi:LSU ribosomal protein L10p (P0) [hydrothermal vent metagenome]|uniref:LSU ribosomal protein L10p (P0) n=1 Tax=hydrothermal vent metagenome TaxID=652676 RepID=A0A1W1BVI2_9ZZZZ
MTRTEKVELVAEMTESFTDAAAIIVCDYKGLTVAELESVRKMARENESKVKVVNNKLASIALANANQEKIELVDTNLVIWGDDQISACKIADKSATDFKNKFIIKTGLLEGKVVDLATINAMAKLPSRDELIGMLLNVWNAPVQNFTIGLSALATKKEEEA